jgi:hypothetical protein
MGAGARNLIALSSKFVRSPSHIAAPVAAFCIGLVVNRESGIGDCRQKKSPFLKCNGRVVGSFANGQIVDDLVIVGTDLEKACHLTLRWSMPLARWLSSTASYRTRAGRRLRKLMTDADLLSVQAARDCHLEVVAYVSSLPSSADRLERSPRASSTAAFRTLSFSRRPCYLS